jgi:hypothetical protein
LLLEASEKTEELNKQRKKEKKRIHTIAFALSWCIKGRRKEKNK